MRAGRAIAAAALIGAAASTQADAQAPLFYLGAWHIASAVVAPWSDASMPPYVAEMKALVGKSLSFRTAAIDGPRQLACHTVKYRLIDTGPELLFHGELAEQRPGRPAPDPATLAAQLGFKGTSWKTLETGCANEIEFHFLDEKTAEFGLNNYVYRIEKK